MNKNKLEIELMFRLRLFLVCIFNNIKDNVIIVLLLFIFAFLLTIVNANISQMIAGVVWSIFASLILIEPMSFYNNEKRYFKITYMSLMLLNHCTGALLGFAKNTLMLKDIDIDDLYFGVCQGLPEGRNAEDFKLDAHKKYILLHKVWQKLFSTEYENKKLEKHHIESYKKLQAELKWRMEGLVDDLEFHSSKRLLISNLFTSKIQKKFFMPDDINGYKQLGQQYGILMGVFGRIIESNFLEKLFDSYMYFSCNKLK